MAKRGKRRASNPHQLVRKVYYLVSATKGGQELWLNRKGKLVKKAVNAQCFSTARQAITKATAVLSRFPELNQYWFDIRLGH